MNDFKYRPDIDGLRAIAVGLVLLFHADLKFTGGYIGVDVFFVISGFLITGLILKRQSEHRFRLTDFWTRRIRRILPASILVTAATLVAAAFVFMPDDYENLGESVIFQQLMVSNIYFWQSAGYFTSPVENQPLLHTWSLAVEEQFYLIYPLILVGLGRFSRKTQWRVLLVLLFSSFVGSEWMVHAHPDAAFYLLPTRAWELILGGLICFFPSPRGLKQNMLNNVSLASLLTILVCDDAPLQ
ncbi:MAG: acyltransferase [Planctomycetaceae bacterium]|nr:acyltransferase [Planctomycetaceae bacterium]